MTAFMWYLPNSLVLYKIYFQGKIFVTMTSSLYFLPCVNLLEPHKNYVSYKNTYHNGYINIVSPLYVSSYVLTEYLFYKTI